MKPTINASTKIYGILGHPVKHSLSPLIHNTSFQLKNYNGVYLGFDIEHPDENTKRSFLELGIHGLSVTIPHKNWAYDISDSTDSLSKICKASNTLIRTSDGTFHAYNTDGPGALHALHTKVNSLTNKNILILGYGGSASAIAHALLLEENPRTLYIGGRNLEKIKVFLDSLHEHSLDKNTILTAGNDLRPEDVDIIINTTPLGMDHSNRELPLDADFVRDFHTVFDIVYIPQETPLLKLAKSKNAEIVYGYLMLLYQAVLQFELFTGEKAPVDAMEQALKEALQIH